MPHGQSSSVPNFVVQARNTANEARRVWAKLCPRMSWRLNGSEGSQSGYERELSGPTFGSLLQQELSMMAGYSENLASPVSPHKTVELGGGLSLVPRLLPAENRSLGTRLGWVLSRDTFSLSNYQRQWALHNWTDACIQLQEHASLCTVYLRDSWILVIHSHPARWLVLCVHQLITIILKTKHK